jgi:hypothetical protein
MGFLFNMNTSIGISFLSDESSAPSSIIVCRDQNGLLVRVFTHRSDGSVITSGIYLSPPQVIELVEYLNPGTFTE